MAILYVTEFAFQGKDGANDVLPVAMLPALIDQAPITISAASARSAVLNAQTMYVRVFSDTACFITTGSATPTATTSKMPLAANVAEYFAVPLNCGWKIAAITA